MALYDISARLVLEGVDDSSVQRAISGINSSLEKGTKSSKSFYDAVTLKGVNLAGYAALGGAMAKIGMMVASATHDAIRFDQELAKLAQTVGVSNRDIREHSDAIRTMSVSYGLSAPKIAETVRVLAQAGYSLNQAKVAADELAKTTLLASFESISNTTEGLIAINKQFTETVGQSARVLSLLNVVAKKYAVESDDLVDAAKRAGGVFAATGGSLEELVTIYTTVRDTTRESSETISTGLRTIFSRLQRPKTIDYLRQFGIELTDLKGNFIGNYQAILEIQKGIERADISPGSLQFAEIVEQLGGVLQQSRVIPLLTQAAKMQRIYADAQNASSETAADLAKAQETLSFKLAQTQQNFAKLIGDVMETGTFKAMISTVLSLTNAFIGFAGSIKELIPLLATFAAIKLSKSLLGVGLPSFGRGETPIKRASGGFVPGSGSGDTVPAMLEPGEFVIRKSAAQAFGADALHKINKYGKGPSRTKEPQGVKATKGQGRSSIDLGSIGMIVPNFGKDGKDQVIAGTYNGKPYSAKVLVSSTSMKTDAFVDAQKRLRQSLSSSMKKFDIPSEGISRTTSRLKLAEGQLFEEMVLKLSKMDSPGNDLLDVKQVTSKLNSILDSKLPLGPADIKLTNNLKNRRSTAEKLAKTKFPKNPQKKARGGATSGTDTVPALLTPGEFVVNKESAEAFGYGNLHKVNKYAKGGPVQRFSGGGETQKINGVEWVSTDFTNQFDELIKALNEKDSPKTNTTPVPTRVSDREAAVVAESADIQAKIKSRKRQQEEAAAAKEADRVANSGTERFSNKDFSDIAAKDPISIPATVIAEKSVDKQGNYVAPTSKKVSQPSAPISATIPTTGQVANPAKASDIADPQRIMREEQTAREMSQALDGPLGNTSSRPLNIATPGMAAKQAAYNKNQEGAGLGPAMGNTKSNPVNISGVGDKLTSDSKAKSESAAKAQQLAGTFATLGFVISGVADQYTDQETVMGRMTSSVLNLVSGLSIFQGVLGQFGKSLDPKSVLDFGKNLLNFGKGGKGAIAGKIANASSGFLGKAGGLLGKAGGAVSAVGTRAGSSIVGGIGTKLSSAGTGIAGGAAKVGAIGSVLAAAAVAGTAVFAFGKALDSARGLEEAKNKAIADGNIAEAGKAAVTAQAQDDLTKLSAGFAATASLVPVIGPLVGALGGVTLKLLGMIPGAESLIGLFRDAGSAMGLLESTTLIAARAQSEAATVAADKNREKQSSIVNKKIEGITDVKGANELTNSGLFANSANALANQKKASKNKISEINNNRSFFNSASTTTGYDEEVTKEQENLKSQAQADFQQYGKVFDLKIQDFTGSGEKDWNKFLTSLSEGEREMILLSGNATILQETMRQSAVAIDVEKAARLLNWQIIQKTSGALKQLAAASKKGAEASRLGDVTSDLSSGNFRSSAISSAASSDLIKTQSVAAKALGINNYENIVGKTTKNKDVLKQAENKLAQGTLKEGELDSIKRKIIQDLNPDANVKDLKGDDLNKAVEAVFVGGDAMKEALLKAANDTESGVNKYIDSVSRVTSAQTEYSQSLLDFSQTNTNRDKEKQGFRVGGSTIAEIRGRQTPIGSNIEGRRRLVANSARLSTIGTSVVANQAAQSASGKEDPSKTAATVSQGIELQKTFSGLQIATEAQKAAVIQDTQARQQLIDALKEEIELEKGRAQTLDEFNTALSGAAGAEAKRDAQKKLASVKRVEQAYATGGVDAANKEIGRSVDNGVSRDFLLSAMQTQTSEALGYRASESGSIEAMKRYGAGANQSGFIADSASVAFGRDAEGKRTRQTVRGAEVSAQAGSQMDEQRANDAALLKLQSDNIEMLSNSAKIFGDSISQMTAGLGSFNTELKTIVASLKDSSISMKLDTTKVVVDINSSQGLEAMSAETKRMVKQMVADQLLAQQQGQV